MKIDENDKRVVLTLDAGGTNFVFVAVQGGKRLGRDLSLPAESNNLDKSIANIKKGFHRLIKETGKKPTAISFAFPGPADFQDGVIYNVGNLLAYAGGVALKTVLEEEFQIPVYINNDGDLFTYGEAMRGFLPCLNQDLEKAGSSKRYRNLFGLTLGTGFGGGLVCNGEMYTGDNSSGLEVWTLYNIVRPESYAEEGASIRAIQKAYAARAGIEDYTVFTGKDIEDIAVGKKEGNREAALASYNEMGKILGEVCATAATLFDCPIVIGGGLSYGHRLFMDALIAGINRKMYSYNGKEMNRVPQTGYNLEDPEQKAEFFKSEPREIKVYGSDRVLLNDPFLKIGVGITKLGTSEAVAMGAYAYALNELEHRK